MYIVAGGRHTLRCYKDGAVAIDLRNICNVFIDSEKGVAHVGGGAKLFNLDLECEAHGNKFAVAGTNASTGVGGYTIGGGWGFQSRLHGGHANVKLIFYSCAANDSCQIQTPCLGMAVDNLLEAELVTADGKLHVVSAKNEPDLLWALKGAGHNYGVVTKFVLQLHEVNTCLGGLIIRPFPSAAHVLKSYVNHFYGPKPAALEDATSVVLTYGPPGPDGVQPAVAMVLAAYVGAGTDADARAALADLLDDKEGNVVVNTVAPIPYATGLQTMLEPVQPPGLWVEKSMLVDGPLPEALQAQLIDSFSKAPTKGCSIVIHPVGGRIGEIAPDATAFPHRLKTGSWVVMIGRSDTEEDYAKLEAWVRDEYVKWQPFKAGAFANEVRSPK